VLNASADAAADHLASTLTWGASAMAASPATGDVAAEVERVLGAVRAAVTTAVEAGQADAARRALVGARGTTAVPTGEMWNAIVACAEADLPPPQPLNVAPVPEVDADAVTAVTAVPSELSSAAPDDDALDDGGMAAGWYPDPYGTHDLRYWDGSGWSEHGHRQDLAASPPEIVPPPAVLPTVDLAALPPPPAPTGKVTPTPTPTPTPSRPVTDRDRLARQSTALGSKHRAGIGLRAQTVLAPDDVADLVRELCVEVKGGGKSLLTTGVWNVGANLVVQGGGRSYMVSIQSGGILKGNELCRFPVKVLERATGCELVIGGLAKYRTHQLKVFYVAPISPKRIEGFDPYRRFLDVVAAELLARDASAAATIGEL